MNINIVDTIKNVVNNLCQNKRKLKYSAEYYIKNIIIVPKDVVSWKALKLLYNDDIKKKYHYKIIADKFLEIRTLDNIKK
jgi:hypothetical protein